MSLRLKSLSKSRLFFAPLLLLPYSLNSQALSAQTSSVIQGTAPYLTFDDGVTKVMSVEGLLGIKLPNSSYIPPGINSPLYPNAIIDTSSMDNAIEMPNITDTFASIQTIVPIENYPDISLSDLVNLPYKYGRDDDGDTGISATGNFTIRWQDSSGRDITSHVKNNLNTVLNLCDAPYKLTLTATDGVLSTQYGIPNSSHFTGNSHHYYINPKMEKPIACHAQPNLAWDNYSSKINIWEDGPNWVAKKGFKIIDEKDPTQNFPTTASNNLFFYLLLGGITPEQVIAANGETVSATSGTGVTLLLSKESTPNWAVEPALEGLYKGGDIALKIVLKGPSIDSSNKQFTPSLFKLYSDSSHTKLLYSFKIERWYIAQRGDGGGYINAQNVCRSLSNNYRVPNVEDYSNANGNDWTGGIPGRNINEYQRRLSYRDGSRWVGGIFNEWGLMFAYAISDWTVTDYWAVQIYDKDHFSVGSGGGNINHVAPSTYDRRIACVTP